MNIKRHFFVYCKILGVCASSALVPTSLVQKEGMFPFPWQNVLFFVYKIDGKTKTCNKSTGGLDQNACTIYGPSRIQACNILCEQAEAATGNFGKTTSLLKLTTFRNCCRLLKGTHKTFGPRHPNLSFNNNKLKEALD